MQRPAETVAELIGYTGKIRWDTTRPNGQPRRKLDTRRAKERFGFAAKIGFEEGLSETIAWYREYIPSLTTQHLGRAA